MSFHFSKGPVFTIKLIKFHAILLLFFVLLDKQKFPVNFYLSILLSLKLIYNRETKSLEKLTSRLTTGNATFKGFSWFVDLIVAF